MRALIDALETRLLRRPGWLRTPGAPAIRVSSSCFTVRELSVPWDAVSRIEASRNGRYDDIRLDIRLDIGTAMRIDAEAHTITLSESQRGFDDFVAMADRKLTFPLGWWDQLGGPRRRGLTLFERFTQG